MYQKALETQRYGIDPSGPGQHPRGDHQGDPKSGQDRQQVQLRVPREAQPVLDKEGGRRRQGQGRLLLQEAEGARDGAQGGNSIDILDFGQFIGQFIGPFFELAVSTFKLFHT